MARKRGRKRGHGGLAIIDVPMTLNLLAAGVFIQIWKMNSNNFRIGMIVIGLSIGIIALVVARGSTTTKKKKEYNAGTYRLGGMGSNMNQWWRWVRNVNEKQDRLSKSKLLK